MDNFRIIYKILKKLEAALDAEEFDINEISPERLGISEARWERLMIMLAKDGYIEGLIYDRCLDDYSDRLCGPIRPVITLTGLEYLADNSMMKKAAKIAKGIKDVVPGL